MKFYPIHLEDGRTVVPVTLIKMLHEYEAACNYNGAQSDDTRALKREILPKLAKLGMEWSTEDLVSCGHPYYKKFSERRFFVSRYDNYCGQTLESYEEACKRLEQAADVECLVGPRRTKVSEQGGIFVIDVAFHRELDELTM